MNKISISNLAWGRSVEHDALSAVAELNVVAGIEVAPTKIAAWHELSPKVLRIYRDMIRDYGLSISSLQAIFYSVEGAQLLQGAGEFGVMRAHLDRVADIAMEVGAHVAVFGAARCRRRGSLDRAAAKDLAIERFAKIAEQVGTRSFVLGLEPMPACYGADIFETWQECLELVEAVDHPAVRLHLDTGCVMLGGGHIGNAIARAGARTVHFQAAEPHLAGFENPVADHEIAADALHAIGYDGWVSIEMAEIRADLEGRLSRAISFVAATYR